MANLQFNPADVPPGSGRLVGNADAQNVAVFNVDGKFCATQTRCTHKQAALLDGELSGSIVTCPYHGSQFDVLSGEVVRGPATDPLQTYPVEIEGDMGRIGIGP